MFELASNKMPSHTFGSCVTKAPNNCSMHPATDVGLGEIFPVCSDKMQWVRDRWHCIDFRMNPAMEGHTCDFQHFLADEGYCPFQTADGIKPKLTPRQSILWCPADIHAP